MPRGVANGEQFPIDAISLAFAEKMTLGKCGPDARREKYSFLKEITQEQMYTYTPGQIATILAQRDKVRLSALAVWSTFADMRPGDRYNRTGAASV